MQIDPQRQQAAVSSQEAERAAREADVAYARQQQQRASELFTAGAVSKQELEQAQTALRTAEASLQALQAQVQQQQVQLRYYSHHRPHLRHRRRRAGARRDAGVVADGADDDRAERYPRGVRERAGRAVRGSEDRPADSRDEQRRPRHARGDDDQLHFAERGRGAVDSGQGRREKSGRRACARRSSSGRASCGEPPTALVVPVTAVSRISGQYFVFVADGTDGKLVARQRGIKVGPIVGDELSRARRHQARRPGRRLRLAEARGGRADRSSAGNAGSTGAMKLQNCRRCPLGNSALLQFCHP